MMLEQFHMPLAKGFGVREEACGREEKEPDCNATKGRAEGGTWEKKRPNEGHSPQETAEEGTCHEVEGMHRATRTHAPG